MTNGSRNTHQYLNVYKRVSLSDPKKNWKLAIYSRGKKVLIPKICKTRFRYSTFSVRNKSIEEIPQTHTTNKNNKG